MLKGIISLIKFVISALEKHHELLEAIYHLVVIFEHCKPVELLRNIWLSIEWSRLLEQSYDVLMLAERYFN